MIECVCQQCGKTFMAREGQIKQGYAKFCSLKCFGKAISCKVEVKCQYCGKNFLTKLSVLKRGSGKFCSMQCYGQSKRGQAPPWVKYPQSGETREKMSTIRQKQWNNPEFAKKMMLAFNKKPTKPEKQLDDILRKYFPQYKYNGDGRLGIMIGGQIPDFPNVNGKKDLIEVFGDYYHSPEVIGDAWRRSELGKIMIYNSLGWRCLVIWEHELKELTEDEIVLKIKNFSRRKYAHAANL